MDGAEEAPSINGKPGPWSIEALEKNENELIRKGLFSQGIQPTGHLVEAILKYKAKQKLLSNIEKGIKVDNFGNTRQSLRTSVNADSKKMRGEDPYIDMGGNSSRGSWTTRNMGNETRNISKLKMIGKGIREVTGVVSDMTTLAQVMRKEETPFALINPLSFIMDGFYNEIESDLLQNSILQGFSAFEKYINNGKGKYLEKFTENSDFLFLSDTEFDQVISGEISSINQFEGKVEGRDRSDYNNAVYVKFTTQEKFNPIVGFSNINK